MGSTVNRAARLLQFDPRPTRLALNAATYHLDLAPQQVSSLFVAVSCNKPARSQAGSIFFAGCWRIAARMRQSTAGPPPASKHPIIFSTRCCASRWPTSTC